MSGAVDSTRLEALEALLGKQPASLPEEVLRDFVRRQLGRRQTFLRALEAHPPPCYLLDLESLRNNARAFCDAFARVLPEVAFYYAVKSNNHPEVARELVRLSLALDVSSGLELGLALSAGARQIAFSGPGKTDAELRLAVDHADRVTVLVDSFGELERLGRIARDKRRSVAAGVRLCTNPRGLWRKFGIPLEAVPDFWRAAAAWKEIELQGLQFHTSWNRSPDAQIAFLSELGRALAGWPEAIRSAIRFIDIGGGYWPEMGEWLQHGGTPEGKLEALLDRPAGPPLSHFGLPAMPIGPFAEAVGQAVRESLLPHVSCRICLEPGRWLANEAMHLALTVVDKKAEDLVITDAGTNAIGWERFETDYFPILNLTRPSLDERPCHVLGALCTPHDLWGFSYFGGGIEPGDVLLIPCQGAYTWSLRQQFIKPVPEVVLLEG